MILQRVFSAVSLTSMFRVRLKIQVVVQKLVLPSVLNSQNLEICVIVESNYRRRTEMHIKVLTWHAVTGTH